MQENTVMLWIGGASNHQALACRIAANVPVSEIIVERRAHKHKSRSFRQLLDRILGRTIFRTISNAWKLMQERYSCEFTALPETRILEVEDIHSDEAREFARSSHATLVAVSGTRMIRASMLTESAHRQILNLHTGLSPFVKGGPNCTNWCIAKKTWHLIGNTVMWIDAGIDSGDVVATETVPLLGNESLLELHSKVMNHAHDLYVRAIQRLWEGHSVPRVRQEHIGGGVTYLSRQWNSVSKARMLINWQNFHKEVNSEECCRLRKSLKTVSLDST